MEENEELTAKEWFGEDFVKKFEELKSKLSEAQTNLRIHGTSEDSAKSIMMNGLSFSGETVKFTSYDYCDYKRLKNWPHKGFRYLVLLGIPLEATKAILVSNPNAKVKPLYKLDDNESSNTVLPAEFIIGYIDANKKEIIENPAYLSNHSYDGLYIVDSELGMEPTMDLYEGFEEDLKIIRKKIDPEKLQEGLNVIEQLLREQHLEEKEDAKFEGVDLEDGW